MKLNRKKLTSFQQMVLQPLNCHMQYNRMKLEFHLTLHTKINSKSIIDRNVRDNNYKTSKRKHRITS